MQLGGLKKGTREMNNEPVAWMLTDRVVSSVPIKGAIPLYTHPAKTLDRELLDKTITDQQNEIKELRKNLDVALMIVNEPAKTLTDEEMEIIAEALLMIGFKDDFINYDLKEKAQAILRKAQE